MSESICECCGRSCPSDPETGYTDNLCPECERNQELADECEPPEDGQ